MKLVNRLSYHVGYCALGFRQCVGSCAPAPAGCPASRDWPRDRSRNAVPDPRPATPVAGDSPACHSSRRPRLEGSGHSVSAADRAGCRRANERGPRLGRAWHRQRQDQGLLPDSSHRHDNRLRFTFRVAKLKRFRWPFTVRCTRFAGCARPARDVIGRHRGRCGHEARYDAELRRRPRSCATGAICRRCLVTNWASNSAGRPTPRKPQASASADKPASAGGGSPRARHAATRRAPANRASRRNTTARRTPANAIRSLR